MDATMKLDNLDKDTTVDKGRYKGRLESSFFLSHTRSDINFAVSSTVRQYMNCPIEEHMEAVDRILRYLKMTMIKDYFFKGRQIGGLKYSLMLKERDM